MGDSSGVRDRGKQGHTPSPWTIGFGGPIKPDYLTDRLGANLDGMLAEYAVLSEEALVHLPSHLSFKEAATLPCAAGTAWVALTGHRQVTAGDTVLTQGSGGVSVFALQFARLLGAQVIATTSTAEKAERLKALGASDVINYTETPDWDVRARELTDGRGVDCVVEIGGPGTIAMSLKALAVGGHLSLIGASLSRSGTGLDPSIVDRPRHYARLDQRREPHRFRGDESSPRTALLASGDRSDIPVRRSKGGLPAFRGISGRS
jgi:NADPH:quinone reductase-like Zn-dependent oxidoreductase